MSVRGLINYYKDCYQEDSADFNLKNLKRLAKEDLLVLTGKDELAGGTLHRVPIPPGNGESLQKRCAMYQRERVLLHCSLFVSGSLPHQDNNLQVFSPLVFNEASIEKDEYGYYFTAVTQDASVNEELLAILLPEVDLTPLLTPDRLYDAGFWVTQLKNSPYQLATIEALHFPDLQSKPRANKSSANHNAHLLPMSALALVERSNSSRGVLHDIAQIQESKAISNPLQTLFNRAYKRKTSAIQVNHNLVPALLSAPQKRVLDMAANLPLSAVSGPPGTGKSYTISAIAAEHCTRGESVLICAGSETALDVIAQKMSDDFGLQNLFVRAGQKSFLKEFQQYLKDLLAGYFNFDDAELLSHRKKEVKDLVQGLEKIEQSILTLSTAAIRHGELSHAVETDIATLWQKLIHRFSVSSVQKLQNLWDLETALNELLQVKDEKTAEYLRALKADTISSLLKKDRKSVQNLNKASRARSSAKQKEYFSQLNMHSILKGFPVWLVSLNALHRVLPLQSELFDLVIIDEATQCNIAASLPALYRAKRTVVVGDQKQLRHFSFLAKTKEQQFVRDNLIENHDLALSYRDSSILDLVHQALSDQSHLAFLDEHFRSQPELIHFSNHEFYHQRLKVMQHRPCSTSGHIEVLHTGGIQNAAGHNHREGEFIITELKQLIAKDKDAHRPHSIGILSMFAKQSQYLATLVEKDISLNDIEKHSIKVATPYGFQGEERDIMLLSFGIDTKKKRAAVYLNKPDVFNVAVTRARQKQILYLSLSEHDLPEKHLLKRYLSGIEKFSSSHNEKTDNDEFQTQVISELEKHDITCWKGYEMLGTYIDVLARRENHYLAIDLIGYPGPYSDFFELDSYKVIRRAGVNVFSLSYALWQQDKERCINAVLEQGFTQMKFEES